MNEDSVVIIMCEKCVYRIRILKKVSGTIGRYLFKRHFLLDINLEISHVISVHV